MRSFAPPDSRGGCPYVSWKIPGQFVRRSRKARKLLELNSHTALVVDAPNPCGRFVLQISAAQSSALMFSIAYADGTRVRGVQYQG